MRDVCTVFLYLWLQKVWWFRIFPNARFAANKVLQVIINSFFILVTQLHQTKSFGRWHFRQLAIREFDVYWRFADDQLNGLPCLQVKRTNPFRRMSLYFSDDWGETLLYYFLFELMFGALLFNNLYVYLGEIEAFELRWLEQAITFRFLIILQGWQWSDLIFSKL